MKQFADITDKEWQEITRKALDFKAKNGGHIARIMSSTRGCVAPSGTELFDPRLWKGCHWVWFEKIEKRKAARDQSL